MPARLIAFPPDRPAVTQLLADGDSLRIGRAPDCGLLLDHPSVSRQHAALSPSPEGWHLVDLGSKNGSYLDGKRIAEAAIAGAHWLRFGDVLCEFTPLSAAEIERAAERLDRRRADSIALVQRLERQTAFPGLLEDTLRAVCELAECERGFLLLREGTGLQVAAVHALDPAQLGRREFSGSVGAVERALRSGETVVSNEAASDPQLGSRHSVVAGGLRTLVCLPLLDGGRTLGVVYADSRQPGARITELDIELLQAFTSRAALWIAAHRDATALAVLAARPRWEEVIQPHAGPRP